MNLILNLVLFFVFHHIFFVPLQLDFLEADFLVNADESNMAGDAIKAAKESIFHTKTGKKLLQDIYLRTDRMK